MKKRTKVLISTICALVMCFGIVGGVSAAVNVNSNGIIRFTGEDGRENTTDDIVFDAADITTLANEVDAEKGKVVAGKQGLVTAINSATASSSVPTNFETTEANLPDFAQLKDAINNVKKAGNEEVWAEIKSGLADKKDSAGNPIYAGVTDLDSLKNAITADNDNFIDTYTPVFSRVSSSGTVNHGEDIAGKSATISGLEVGKKYILYCAYINKSTLDGAGTAPPTFSQTMDTAVNISTSTVGYSPGTQYPLYAILYTFTATSPTLTFSTPKYSGARWTTVSVISYE